MRSRALSLFSVLPDVAPQLRALVLGWIYGFLLVLCWQTVREHAAHPQTSQGSSAQPAHARQPRAERGATPATSPPALAFERSSRAPLWHSRVSPAPERAVQSLSDRKLRNEARQTIERRTQARARGPRSLRKTTRRAR